MWTAAAAPLTAPTATVATIFDSEPSRKTCFVLPERISNNYSLLWNPQSRFINRFFRRENCLDDGCRCYREQDESASPIKANSSLIRHATPTSRTRSLPSTITFRSRNLNFRVFVDEDRLRIINQKIIWMQSLQNKSLSLGMKLHLPESCFGLITYEPSSSGYVCMTDLVETNRGNPDALIVNLTGESHAIKPGRIRGVVRVYPYFVPEPWETVNLTSPHNNMYFSVRLKQQVTIPALGERVMRMDCSHLCDDRCYSALGFGTRQMGRIGVLTDPFVWPAGQMPTVRLLNATRRSVRLSPNTAVARVIFTSPGFSVERTENDPVGRFACPKTDVTLRRTLFSQ